MRRNKKRAFTLIELVLTLAVATLLFGAVGFSLMRSIRAEKLKEEVNRLTSKIELLRHIRAQTHAEMDFKLSEVEGGVQGSLTFFSPLPIKLVKFLSKDLLFKGAKLKVEGKKGVSEITLLFRKEGELIPEISLYSKKDEMRVIKSSPSFLEWQSELNSPQELLNP